MGQIVLHPAMLLKWGPPPHDETAAQTRSCSGFVLPERLWPWHAGLFFPGCLWPQRTGFVFPEHWAERAEYSPLNAGADVEADAAELFGWLTSINGATGGSTMLHSYSTSSAEQNFSTT